MPATNSLPLTGKRIVVTRAIEQAQDLVGQLSSLGAEVFLLPLVRFADPLDWSGVDRALDALHEYDWIFFTSQNAVDSFSRRCRERGVAPSKIAPKVAAVGPATADAARREGFSLAHVAQQFRGSALVSDLADAIKDKRILLPRSDRAREELPRAIRERGAMATEVIVYKTLSPDLVEKSAIDAVREGSVDVIVFFSPSAFHYLLDVVDVTQLRSLAGKLRFAAIGPVTARAIREVGFPVDIVAQDATTAALVEALVQRCAQRSPIGEKME